MSDRDTNPASRPDDDDDLAYLDAGLTDEPDQPEQPTMPIDDAAVQVVTPPVVHDIPPDPMPDAVEPVAMEPEPLAGAAVPFATSTPAVDAQATRDSSWTWPLFNLVGLIVVVAVNFAANYFEFNGFTTGDVVNRNPVQFQPAGWVFSIWGVIYLLLAVFVVYGLLPAGRKNPRLQRISPLFLVANIANVVWIFFWHWQQFSASLGTMLVLLVSLIGIYVGIRARNPLRRDREHPVEQPGRLEKLVLRVPFSVYLGWVLVASLANLMVWFDRTGRDGGVFSQSWWAIILMTAGTLVAALFMATSRDAIIAAVMAVAFVGIAQHNWGESTMVSVAAIVFTVIAAGIAGMAFVMAFDRETNRSPFGGSPEEGRPLA